MLKKVWDKCAAVSIYISQWVSAFRCMCAAKAEQKVYASMTSCWRFHIHSGVPVRLLEEEKEGRWKDERKASGKNVMAPPQRVRKATDVLSRLHPRVCMCVLFLFILYPLSLSHPSHSPIHAAGSHWQVTWKLAKLQACSYCIFHTFKYVLLDWALVQHKPFLSFFLCSNMPVAPLFSRLP